MKRIGFILLAIAAVLVGLLIGTLNSSPVQLDLLWLQLESPLGLVILMGFSLGIVMGLGIIYFSRVLPLRLQLRKIRAKLIKQDTADLNLPDD
jgi:putative membrane protein